jgi:hypothetical protein
MRVPRLPLPLALAGALLLAAACSDSTAPNGVLTVDETSELAAQMGIHLADAFSTPAMSAARIDAARTSAARTSAVPAPFGVTVDLTVPCPRGGSARITANVTGTIDEATESVIADVTGTQRPNNCGYDVHGKTIRVTGSLTATAHAEIEHGVPVRTQRASVEGQFSWVASDGRRGSCSVKYTATANYTTNVATVDGNFCGSTIQVTGPITG